MVVKASLDLLLVYVNYSEQESGSVTPVKGSDTPSRNSPDAFPSNSLLLKDAVEIVSEDKGREYLCPGLVQVVPRVGSGCI